MSGPDNSLHVELHVPDFNAAKQFYLPLGFRVIRENQPKDKDGYLVLKNDAGCIIRFWSGNNEIYKQSYFKQFNPDTKRGYGVEIIIITSLDLKELEGLVENAGGKLAEPVKERSWGLADFRCVDPFGYYLCFTTPHDVTGPKYQI